jgi:hypothetical protein
MTDPRPTDPAVIDFANIDFDSMKPEEFENVLPDLFANGDGKVSQDPRLQKFLTRNPDCAALVRDLETIAETARNLFEPVADPSDKVWKNIQSKLREEAGTDPEPEDEVKEID